MINPFATIYGRVGVALAIAATVGGAVFLHQSAVHDAIAAAEKRGSDAAYARVETKARAVELAATNLTASIWRKASEQSRATSDRADAVRLSGPGKAACPASVPFTPGRHDAAAPEASAPVVGVPDQERVDLIGLPFAPTVKLVEQHDLCLIEAQAWRNQNAGLRTISTKEK